MILILQKRIYNILISTINVVCHRCSIFRCDSLSRVSSNSSLNEFVKQKMQNRPPCYDDIEKDRKVPIDANLVCTNKKLLRLFINLYTFFFFFH